MRRPSIVRLHAEPVKRVRIENPHGMRVFDIKAVVKTGNSGKSRRGLETTQTCLTPECGVWWFTPKLEGAANPWLLLPPRLLPPRRSPARPAGAGGAFASH